MRFSIITPSYRQLDWLTLCAASIADQGGEVEHLVQDAGSPGIEAWIALHPQVQVRVEKDGGMYDAINRGLSRATGDILAYLNCDEQYLPGTLQKVGEYFTQHPEIDLLFGDALLVDTTGAPLSYRRVVSPGRLHTRFCHLGVWSCAMFFRRKVWDEGLQFSTNYRAIGDAVFVEEALTRDLVIAVLPTPLAVFVLGPDNLGASRSALEEAREWRSGFGPLGKVLSMGLRLQHWAQKALAGAYWSQKVSYTIYTPRSPRLRETFHAASLNWKWPGKQGKI